MLIITFYLIKHFFLWLVLLQRGRNDGTIWSGWKLWSYLELEKKNNRIHSMINWRIHSRVSQPAAALQPGCEEMEKEWGNEEEMEREWGNEEEMERAWGNRERLILYISSFSLHFLAARLQGCSGLWHPDRMYPSLHLLSFQIITVKEGESLFLRTDLMTGEAFRINFCIHLLYAFWHESPLCFLT